MTSGATSAGASAGSGPPVGTPQEVPALLDDVVADRDRLIRALRRLPYGQTGSPTTGSPTTGTAAGPATSKPAVETAAYVTARIEAALGKADNYMIRTATHGYSGGVYTEWTDPRTGSSYAEQGAGSHKILSWNSTFLSRRSCTGAPPRPITPAIRGS
jgi:hypothetical protein